MPKLSTNKVLLKKKNQADLPLVLGFSAIIVIGILMLYSASTVVSFRNFGNTSYFATHQLLYGLLPGLVVAYICSKIDYHFWEKLIPILAVVSLLALALVKLPGVGFSAGGATRWIRLGFITFQPAELAKFAVIVYTAGWISKKQMELRDFYLGLFPYLVVMGLFSILILWQPDVGTMLSLIFTGGAMLFLGGLSMKYFAGIGGVGALLMAIIIKLEPYRMERLLTFLNPSADPKGAGYQINQALLAIGAGGIFGYGYGLSRQKHNYLPEVIGDSIFAVMAEELGLIKVSLIILLFIFVALRGIYISLKAPDIFGRVLGTGIIASIMVQVFINIGAIMGLLPLTGIPLPFISYGSSALIMNLVGLGVLLNISKQAKQ